jgi:hypothetical protein
MGGITIGGKHLSRRTVTLAWIIAASAVVIFFLYKEWIAPLYVMATLGVTALLIIVATADLSGAKKPGSEQTEASNER